MSEPLTVDEFYAFAAEGKLVGLECVSGHVTVPPRRTCRTCGATILKKRELSGMAKVITWTEVYVKSQEFPLDTPYTLVLVELNEGGTMMGILDTKVWHNVAHGDKVRIQFRRMNEKESWPRTFVVPA